MDYWVVDENELRCSEVKMEEIVVELFKVVPANGFSQLGQVQGARRLR